MRIERKLKKLAAADYQKILNENKDFYDSIIAEHYPDPQPMKEKAQPNMQTWKKVTIAFSIFIIATTATLLGVLLPREGDDFDDTKLYFEENVRTKIADIQDIRSSIQSFDLDFDGCLIEESLTWLYFDSISNDELLYSISGTDEDGLEDWRIVIEVNEYYKIPYKLDDYSQSKEFNSYTVQYYSTAVEDDGIYIITTNAIINFAEETVFIKYECLSFEEDDNMFFEWLEKAITVKS